jgi:2-polyprenyl-6-methoxyphenol hydroxylase-like FAD-dependent oxidoreductase
MQLQTQVLIVGAGPVGLTLAIDLGRRGVRCLLIEEQAEPRKLPKMERVNARSMEMYRRLGLANAIRKAGAPETARMDSMVARSMAEEPLVRLVYPSARDASKAGAECRDGTLPLEPAHLVSQYTLEPLLMAEATKTPNVTVRTGCGLRAFSQDEQGVTAEVELTAGEAKGRRQTVRAAYMVGTDGGRSTVRKGLGIPLVGDGGLAKKNQVFVRCDKLWEAYRYPQARMIFFTNADQSILSLQDSLRHFVFHTSCWGDAAELRRIIGETLALPVDFEILATTAWTLHLLVAERYMDRRVLIAGDSAHLVIPTGGLGLNTGIGDAFDLSWKLAGTLQSWGGPHLLSSYDQERRTIGERNKEGARYAALGQLAWRAAVRPNIGEDTPEGRGVKAAVIRLANVEQRKTHEQVGTELGYRYESSPVICSEAGVWPPDVKEVYIPTSRPGARLPHMWLKDESALQDHLGQGYTLLKLRRGTDDASSLIQAMRDTGAPLEVVEIDEQPLRELYGRDLLLLRPDLHVCWRGDKAPADARMVAAIVTGRQASPTWSMAQPAAAASERPAFSW